jgi:S1-C subfamily serine protease
MKKVNFLLFFGLTITVLSSCTSVKYLAISDGSRSDGTLTLMYEYGAFEKPVVQWEAAKKSAIEKCRSWGYYGAEFFDVGTSNCIGYNSYGNCLRWRVIYKCQCTTDPSPQITEASKPKISSGSGFAISIDGIIVTNQHVIDGATEILIKGINGDFSKSYKAKVLIEDKKNDLALVKINDINFNKIDTIPFVIYNKTIDVGSSVYCLGFPLRATMGDEVKLTNGIISSKSGYQGGISSYQLTVAVQPGNSGAPLFDNSGNLVGVINAKHIGAENASYAIKSTYLFNLIDLLPNPLQLTEKGRLSDNAFVKQVDILKKYVYIIEVKQ